MQDCLFTRLYEVLWCMKCSLIWWVICLWAFPKPHRWSYIISYVFLSSQMRQYSSTHNFLVKWNGRLQSPAWRCGKVLRPPTLPSNIHSHAHTHTLFELCEWPWFPRYTPAPLEPSGMRSRLLVSIEKSYPPSQHFLALLPPVSVVLWISLVCVRIGSRTGALKKSQIVTGYNLTA